jgi:transcriptional regulator with AAA-type ATPase domain
MRGGRGGAPESRAWAALVISRVFLLKGRVDLAAAHVRLGASLFGSIGQRACPTGLLVNWALVLKARGKTREAAALLRLSIDRALRRGETLAAAKGAANLVLCVARGASSEDPAPLIALAERSYRALGCEDSLVRLDLTRGLLEASRGAFDDAVERIVRTLGRCGAERLARERLIGRLLLAELFLAKNDLERSRQALGAAGSEHEALARYGPQRVRRLRLEGELRRRAGDREAAPRFMRMAEKARFSLGLAPVALLAGEPRGGFGEIISREDRIGRVEARERASVSFVAREIGAAPLALREEGVALPIACEAGAVPGAGCVPGGPDDDFLTADSRTKALLSEIARAARLPVPILITGESGVGKELIARSIHRWSGREREPFIPVNVAALPAELFESLVFGHERGAFTGAVARTPGLLESAGRGTLFLDEIGELAPSLQAKILRLVDRGEYIALGRSKERLSTARIVAATNRDLESECAAGRFRKDLYYRLTAFSVRIPPLRERSADVPLLARVLLRRVCERYGLGPKTIGGEALRALERYGWPGNVRELESEILGVALKTRGSVIRLGAFSPPLIMQAAAPSAAPDGLDEKVAGLERQEIMKALRASGGNRAQAAALLGLRRTTLIGKMRRLGIEC